MAEYRLYAHKNSYATTTQLMLEELEVLWQVIEGAVDPGPYFLGDSYSICDMLFLMQAIWKENQPSSLSSFPNSKRMMQTAFARPAVQRVIAIHQIENLIEI